MRLARVACAGAIHAAHPQQLADGRAGVAAHRWPRSLAEEEVVWLPPLEVGTVIASASTMPITPRNWRSSRQEEPLVFLKGPGTLLGHRGMTRRPAGVKFMHYECELAVVIGRTAQERARAATPCGTSPDIASRTTMPFAITWRTGTVPTCASRIATVPRCSGPGWSMPPIFADPGNLGLRTYVNGKLTQQGNTRDMIFDIPC